MTKVFESTSKLQSLRSKMSDPDVTLDRENVLFLLDYIEALEIALDFASPESDDDDDDDANSLVAEFVRESLTENLLK